VGNGDHYRPFQVHSLDQVALLKPVTKCVYPVCTVDQIPATIRQAFRDAVAGEPGPVAVVIPYNLLIEVADFHVPPPADHPLPFDDAAVQKAIALLCDRKHRVGIYAGLGCMDQSSALTAVAEVLQSPVATSVSGKGGIDECHPLAVGWGYGKHAAKVAEVAFTRDKLHPLRTGIDVLLAVGVKFSEVSTGYYGNPRPKHVIHVDANAGNLGKVMPADVCVHADAGLFLAKLLACKDSLSRPSDDLLAKRIAAAKAEACADLAAVPHRKCGVDPLAVVAALRRAIPNDGMLFVDVTVSEHLAAEFYQTRCPRTYFNPVDNQSMGWSIPAAIGARQTHPGKTVMTLTGDGCFLMSAMELTTAARAGIPVKFVILDDHAYHYMQMLQLAAYRRTTATELPPIDYAAFAKAVGVAYQDVSHADHLDEAFRQAVCHPGPVLVRVQTDYGDRKIRWLEAVKDRFTKELSAVQKVRFLARIGKRELSPRPPAND
jgi:acetolactate synthase-1/2/3 large subunit